MGKALESDRLDTYICIYLMKTSGGAPWTPKGPVGSLEFPRGGQGFPSGHQCVLVGLLGVPQGPQCVLQGLRGVLGESWGSPGHDHPSGTCQALA